ncbi:hypothetical protein PPYR_08634 [Photinus pyralis]|uniref:Uncharacterized protein n=1 Tax=Photinus pyralis TaxID=7054 RepID=A0A5N4AJY8_PHOPY|nr:uncharacterized protein LOC116172452 [Photinus pyralis]KAB0797641.1 hypothetical protein PPYR_08634 [Photinus pyralis]
MGKLFVLNIFCVLFFNVTSKQIPSYVSLCKINDPNLSMCLKDSINALRPYLVKGIPEMDLPPGEPLQFPSVSADTGANSAVSVKAKSWNHTVSGIMDFILNDISLDLKHSSFSIAVLFPSLRLKGQYTFKGKVLLFEIDTEGTYALEATNVTASGYSHLRSYMKESKEHVEFENVQFNVDVKTAKINFTNLIKGNDEMTEAANTAINQNINIVIDELRGIIGQVFGELLFMYFNSVFRLFPVDELLPEN